MAKFAVVVVLVALAVAVQGFPQRENDIASAAASGDWDQVHRILSNFYRSRYGLTPVGEASVRDLKPVPGGHVAAEQEFVYHSATNNNGKVSEQSGGHKIINNDGRVTEFQFTPQGFRQPQAYTQPQYARPAYAQPAYAQQGYGQQLRTNA